MELLPHTDLVPHQSTVALAALSNGDVIGGTSIETPGGGVPAARQGAVYRLDWRSRKTAAVWYPVPGAREVSQLVTDSRDLVHGLTSDSVYFVMEADTGRVRQQTDLSAWGGVVRQGLVAAELSGRPVILGLLSGGSLRRSPKPGWLSFWRLCRLRPPAEWPFITAMCITAREASFGDTDWNKEEQRDELPVIGAEGGSAPSAAGRDRNGRAVVREEGKD
ncbi:hypothetical protein N6H14_03090 [Paenibacillus sp. CC-CFT747]|nr:hypothetical protein N6H14_03090 [Paenibacillus sp. CC-CFT747]